MPGPVTCDPQKKGSCVGSRQVPPIKILFWDMVMCECRHLTDFLIYSLGRGVRMKKEGTSFLCGGGEWLGWFWVSVKLTNHLGFAWWKFILNIIYYTINALIWPQFTQAMATACFWKSFCAAFGPLNNSLRYLQSAFLTNYNPRGKKREDSGSSVP